MFEHTNIKLTVKKSVLAVVIIAAIAFLACFVFYSRLSNENTVLENEDIESELSEEAEEYSGYISTAASTDYDKDNRRDRLYREAYYDANGLYVSYILEFGNGEKLKLFDKESVFTEISVTSKDILGDNEPEILAVVQRVDSTTPFKQTDIVLLTKDNQEYKSVPLAIKTVDDIDNIHAYDAKFVKYDGENCLKFYDVTGEEYIIGIEGTENGYTYDIKYKGLIDYDLEVLTQEAGDDNTFYGQLHINNQIDACKEDIFYHIEYLDDTYEYLIYLRNCNNELVQMIDYKSDYWDYNYFSPKILTEDVNNDGADDIWLYLGNHANGGVDIWSCYIYDENEECYVRLEGFEKIANAYMNGTLRGCGKCGWGCYSYEQYTVQGSEIILLGTLLETNVDYKGETFLYDEKLYQDGELVSQKTDVGIEDIDTDFWNEDLLGVNYDN